MLYNCLNLSRYLLIFEKNKLNIISLFYFIKIKIVLTNLNIHPTWNKGLENLDTITK